VTSIYNAWKSGSREGSKIIGRSRTYVGSSVRPGPADAGDAGETSGFTSCAGNGACNAGRLQPRLFPVALGRGLRVAAGTGSGACPGSEFCTGAGLNCDGINAEAAGAGAWAGFELCTGAGLNCDGINAEAAGAGAWAGFELCTGAGLNCDGINAGAAGAGAGASAGFALCTGAGLNCDGSVNAGAGVGSPNAVSKTGINVVRVCGYLVSHIVPFFRLVRTALNRNAS
jgi:hypothetical protein